MLGRRTMDYTRNAREMARGRNSRDMRDMK